MFKKSLNLTEKTKPYICFTDMLGLSITIISCLIILTPLTISESSLNELKDFTMNLIDFDETQMDSDSKTTTIFIDGKAHTITVKLIIEQKIESTNIYY